MDPVQRMAALVAAVGDQSLTAEPGSRAPAQSHLDPVAVAYALQVVRPYLANLNPPGARTGDLAVKRSALSLVAAARQAAEDAQAIELAAAAVARDHGGTVRELSAAAEMSERAATTRYRRIWILDPRNLSDEDLADALGDYERVLPDLPARIAAKPRLSTGRRQEDGGRDGS